MVNLYKKGRIQQVTHEIWCGGACVHTCKNEVEIER